MSVYFSDMQSSLQRLLWGLEGKEPPSISYRGEKNLSDMFIQDNIHDVTLVDVLYAACYTPEVFLVFSL